MEYRKLPHGKHGEKLSVLGLGMGGIQKCPDIEIERGIRTAVANGINFFDLCAGDDLALAGDAMAANHYEKLCVKADACIGCGHCDNRCPFHTAQSARMKEIAGYFAK